jgi:hypothetical protein
MIVQMIVQKCDFFYKKSNFFNNKYFASSVLLFLYVIRVGKTPEKRRFSFFCTILTKKRLFLKK